MTHKQLVALVVEELETIIGVSDDCFFKLVQNSQLLNLQLSLFVRAEQQVVLLNINKIDVCPQKEDQSNYGLDDCEPLLSHR